MQAALNSSVFDGVTLAIHQTTYVGDQAITPETRLADDLALGGFGRMRLAIYLEENFDVEISDEVLERFVTVADVAKYVAKHYFRDVGISWLAEAA